MVVGHVPIVVGDNVRVRRRGITKQEMLVINVYDVGKKIAIHPDRGGDAQRIEDLAFGSGLVNQIFAIVKGGVVATDGPD
jgi:hypothetical protein